MKTGSEMGEIVNIRRGERWERGERGRGEEGKRGRGEEGKRGRGEEGKREKMEMSGNMLYTQTAEP